MSIKTYKYRLYPTAKQHVALGAMLAVNCELYNAALQERRVAWAQGVIVTLGSQSRQLKEIRVERPDVGALPFSCLNQTLRRLDGAFQAFFRRVKRGERPGYPRFRASSRFNSVSAQNGSGIRFIDSGGHRRSGRQREARLQIKGVGHVRVLMHRELPAAVPIGRALVVKREGRGRRQRWYLCVPMEVDAKPLPPTGSAIGIDLGLASFLTTSDGQHLPNPGFDRRMADRMTAAQRALARKRSGSTRHAIAVQRVASLHGKTRRQRIDHAHKVAADLISRHDFIAHEALAVGSMVRRPKAVPDPLVPGAFLPNGGAAKAGLNRSILDASWSRFIAILTHKAACAGREVIAVDPAYTSRQCSVCEYVATENRSTQAAFACMKCGHVAHADVNAARNILRAGRALHRALEAQCEQAPLNGRVLSQVRCTERPATAQSGGGYVDAPNGMSGRQH